MSSEGAGASPFSSASSPSLSPEDLSLGWSYHAELVRHLIRDLKPRVLVEIGVNEGGSLLLMAEAEPWCHCYGIDPYHWSNQTPGVGEAMAKRAKRRIDELNHRRPGGITLLQDTSQEANKHFLAGVGIEAVSIDLLHIDGDHTYEAVKWDWEHWSPLVSDRGMVLIHDTLTSGIMGNPAYQETSGVAQLWEELTNSNESWYWYHQYAGPGLGIASRMPLKGGDHPAHANTYRIVKSQFAEKTLAVLH